MTGIRWGPSPGKGWGMERNGLAEDRTVGSSHVTRLRFLETALASIVEGVIIVDAEGRKVLINEAAQRLLEYVPPGKSPGEKEVAALKLRYPDGPNVPPEETPLGRALKGETVVDFPAVLDKPNGDDVFISNCASPVRDEEGRIIGAVTI